MNFKKPFKVLTTAALIGTLSLSAVAPGASASSLDKKVSAKAETKASVENVVLKNKAGELLTLPLGDYLEAKAAGVDFDGAEPVSISTNGKYYSLDDYLEAKASTTNKTEEEAFKLLGGNEQDIKPVEGQINKDGSVTPKDDAPAEEDFKVTEVAAITTTGVDVKFQALTADVKDVTVEVKNSKGETVEVKPANLKKDSTTVSFDFVTPVSESDLTGKWTVDGKTFDFGDQKLVEEINKTAKESSNVVFLEALKAAGLENINEDLANGYKTAVEEADPEFTTVAQVQTAIDNVNAEFGKVEAVINAAMSPTGKEIKVYNALKAGFENVEADYSEQYLNAAVELANEGVLSIKGLTYNNYTGVAAVSFDEIQDAINRVNFFNTAKAVDALWNKDEEPTAAEVAKAKSLVEKYAKYAYQEEDEVTAGQYLEDALKEIELIYNIDKATTKGAVRTAIQNLVDFDADLKDRYIGVSTVKFIMPYDVDANFEYTVPTQQTPAVKSALADWNREIPADNTKVIFDDEDFKVVEANLEAYIKAFDDGKNWGDTNSRTDILTIIKDTNTEQADTLVEKLVEAANKYSATDTTTRAAYLKALKATGVKEYSDANADEYVKVISYIQALDGTQNKEKVLENVQPIVDQANVAAVKTAAAANNGSATVKAIQNLNIDKLEVVDANKAYYLAATSNTGSQKLDGLTIDSDAEAKIAEIVKAGNAAAKEQAQVDAINNATTAAEAKAALDELSLPAYVKIPAADREYVAGLLLEKRDLLTKDRNVVDASGAKVADANLLAGKPKAAKQFYDVNEVTGYFTVDVLETVANIDFDGDKDKATVNAKTTSVVNQRAAVLIAINSVVSNVPSPSTTFEALVATTAEAFKDAEVTGFSKDGDVTAAESAKAEAFLDSDHFFTAEEIAKLGSATTAVVGDSKGDFRNVTDALAYFK